MAIMITLIRFAAAAFPNCPKVIKACITGSEKKREESEIPANTGDAAFEYFTVISIFFPHQIYGSRNLFCFRLNYYIILGY